MTCPKCDRPDEGRHETRCLCSGVKTWGRANGSWALNGEELERLAERERDPHKPQLGPLS